MEGNNGLGGSMTTKGERTKQHILQQAIQLFSKTSFKHVTIRQIAQAADVSPGLIYKYFDTQEDVYYAAMRYASDDLLTKLEPIEHIEEIVDFYLYHMFTSEVLFEMMTYFSLDEDHADHFLPIFNEINQFLHLLEQKIAGPHAKTEAQLLFATLNGLIISYKKIPNRDTASKITAIQKLAAYHLAHLKKRT